MYISYLFSYMKFLLFSGLNQQLSPNIHAGIQMLATLHSSVHWIAQWTGTKQRLCPFRMKWRLTSFSGAKGAASGSLGTSPVYLFEESDDWPWKERQKIKCKNYNEGFQHHIPSAKGYLFPGKPNFFVLVVFLFPHALFQFHRPFSPWACEAYCPS